MSRIRLSKKHGVNPAVDHCWVCGKDTSVVLFGRLPGDREAPRSVVSGEPCDECAALLKQGVALIEIEAPPRRANAPPEPAN